MTPQRLIDDLVFSNESEAEGLTEADRDGFQDGLLFVGCSGLGFSPRERIDCPAESLFVQQSMANCLRSSTDWKSNFEYAIGMNGVRDVVVCGHEDCRVVQDSLKVTEPQQTEGAEEHLVDLREAFRDRLLDLPDNKARADKLARLNVRFQVHFLLDRIDRGDFPDYGSQLRVHGWYWSRSNSQLIDLKVSRVMEV